MADDEDISPELDAMFGKWYERKRADEDAAKERSKPPKDFGEAMDRLANRIWEVGEERAAARRQADEDADQEPSRAKPRSTVERFLFGTEEAS